MKRAEQAVPILFSGGAGRGKRPGTPASRRGACDLDDCLGLSAFVQLVPPEPRPARMRPSFRGRTVRGEHAQPVSRGFRQNSLPRKGDRHGAMPDRPLDRRRLFGPRGRIPDGHGTDRTPRQALGGRSGRRDRSRQDRPSGILGGTRRQRLRVLPPSGTGTGVVDTGPETVSGAIRAAQSVTFNAEHDNSTSPSCRPSTLLDAQINNFPFSNSYGMLYVSNVAAGRVGIRWTWRSTQSRCRRAYRASEDVSIGRSGPDAVPITCGAAGA